MPFPLSNDYWNISVIDINEIEPEVAQGRVNDLTLKVKDAIGNPVNIWAVASTIESMGIRPVDIQRDFGFEGVIPLADIIFRDLKEIEVNETRQRDHEEGFSLWVVLKKAFNRIGLFLNFYKYGLMYILPMLTQIVALFVFKYSLWAYLYFNVAQATIVALGTMMGFIITGGFVQVLGRVISFYAGMENYLLARKISNYFIKWGIFSLLGIALLLYGLNIVIPFYPQSMFILSMIYGFMIGVLILVGAILYALKQTFVISTSIIIGTALVIINVNYFHLNVYVAQWIGIGLAIVMMLGYAKLYFSIKIHSMSKEMFSSTLPRMEVIYYENYRYFLYGFLYFLFLFLDRILAWSAGPPPPTYIIWFKTPYELGMDWALLSLILTVGVLEYSINSFSKLLIPKQKDIFINNAGKFNNYFFSFYIRQLLILITIGILSIIIAYNGVLYFKQFGNEYSIINDFFSSEITFKVFWIGSIGYLFLSIGLLHTLFFFTLARPKYVIYSMIVAVIVNFTVGYLLSRTMHYEDSVFGLAVGALVFAIVSGIVAVRFFKRLDYYYYSAY